MKNYRLSKNQPKGLPFGFLTFFSALTLLLITSCGGGGGGVSSEHVQIPKDAVFVVSIDFNQLTTKSKNWRELVDKDFLESIDMDARDAREAFQLFLNGGMDLQKKGYVFGTLSKEEDNNMIGFSFLLSDPIKFEKTIKEMQGAPDIQSDGDMKYVMDDDKVIGWKGKTALFLGMEDDMEEAALLNKFKEVFNTESGNSLSSTSKEFSQVDGEGHDFAFWVDQQKYNKLYNSEYSDLSELSPTLAEAYKLALYSTGGLDFENGAIKSNLVYHLDKNLSRQYEQLFKSGIHNNVIKSIPIAEPSTIFGFGLSMKILYERLKNESYISEGDEEVKKEFGLSMEEIFDIFDGDFLLTIEDLKTESLIDNPQPDFVFAMGINNKKNLQKIIDTYVNQGLIQKKGNVYSLRGIARKPIYLFEKGDIMYLTMTEAYKDDILAGKGGLKGKYNKAVSKKSSVIYFDVANTVKQIPDFGSVEADIVKNEVAPEIEDMLIDMTPIKNHKLTTETEINFKNKGKNALVTIVDIIKKVKEREKELSLQ